MFETITLAAFAAFAVALQSFASLRVHKSAAYAREQKSAQQKLIWLLPVVGAAMVLAVMHQDGELVARDRGSMQR